MTALTTIMAKALEKVTKSPLWEQEIRIAVDSALAGTQVPGLVVVVVDTPR